MTVIDVALAQIGIPYAWGKASPSEGFDCSGLVMYCFSRVGVSLPRTAQEQYDALPHPSGDPQPGDVVFFANTYASADRITHDGIYLGNDQMIDAPDAGQAVSVQSIADPYWQSHYAGIGRPGATTSLSAAVSAALGGSSSVVPWIVGGAVAWAIWEVL